MTWDTETAVWVGAVGFFGLAVSRIAWGWAWPHLAAAARRRRLRNLEKERRKG